MIKNKIQTTNRFYIGLLIIIVMIVGSIAIVSSMTVVNSNAHNQKESKNSLDATSRNPVVSKSQVQQPSQQTDMGPANTIDPNVRNIYYPTASYKLNAISPGFQVDYSLSIIQFTDHMMSIIAQNDSIRLTISFVVTEQAQYTFNGYLYNSSGVQITSASNQNYYSPGTDHVATIDFSGFSIRQSATNGPYNISLQINKYNGSTYSILPLTHVHTTDYYDWNWFVQAPAPVAGSFALTTTDIDSNGLNDALAVSGSLDLTFGGSYSVYYLLTTKTGSGIDSKSLSYSLPSGINTISTQFNAWSLNIGNYNGTYTLYIQVSLSNSPGWNLIPQTNVSVSQFFNSDSWDSNPLTSVSVSSFTNLDPDGNGLLNSFLVSLNFQSRLSGSVTYYLYVFDNATNNQIFYSYNNIGINQGTSNYNVTFSTLPFYQYGVNTSYYFSISTYFSTPLINDYSSYQWFSNIYTTAQYTTNQFEVAGGTFLGNYSAYGKDTDSDGLYNYISVDVQVQINQIGKYSLSGNIYENVTGINLGYDGETVTFTSTGVKNITLNFNVWNIFNAKDRTWNHSLLLENINFEQYDSVTGRYYNIYTNYSMVYSFSMDPGLFDPYPAYMTSIYSYNLADTYGTSAWDTLTFMIEIEVVEPGQYEICANLDLLSGTQISHSCGSYQSLATNGTVSLSLNFDISALGGFTTNQTLVVTSIYLYSQKYGFLNNQYGNLFAIFNIDPSTIEKPPVLLNNIVGVYPTDSDSNGKYNTITFAVNLTVSQTGYVQIWVNVQDNMSTCSLSGYYSSSSLVFGNNIVNVSIPSYNFLCSTIDSKWMVTSVQANFNSKFSSLINPNFVTETFGPSNLDPKPISQAFSFTGTYVNSDSDPGFDYLAVEFKVNVTKADTYFFTINLDLSSNGNVRGGNNTIVTLSTGTQTVEIRFYNLQSYMDINATYMVDYYSSYGYNTSSQTTTVNYWNSNPNIQVGGEISYTQFDKPDASLGSYMALVPWSITSDTVNVNNTNYPVFNSINLTISVVISKTGTYNLYGYLYSFTNTQTMSYSPSVYLTLSNYAPGVYNISLSFDYQWIRDNLNYTISVAYLKISSSSLTYMSLNYLNQPSISPNTYLPEQFQNPYLKIISYTETGIDTDGNGLIDGIKFDFSVSLTYGFQYLYLEMEIGNSTYYGSSSSVNFNNIGSGIFNFSITIPTDQLYYSGVLVTDTINYIDISGNLANTGPYIYERVVDQSPLNQTFSLSQIDSPAILVNNFSYQFIDINNDSLFDGIDLRVEIEAKVRTNLNLQLSISTNPGSNSLSLSKYFQAVVGTNIIHFKFYFQVFRTISEAPFTIQVTNLYLYNSTNWQQIMQLNNPYTIQITSPSQLNFNVAEFTLTSVQPIDLNSDGKMDALEFNITTSSIATLEFSLQMNFIDSNNNWKYISFNLLLQSGLQNKTMYYLDTAYDFASGSTTFSLNSMSIYVIKSGNNLYLDYLSKNDLLSAGKIVSFTVDSANWSTSYYSYYGPYFDLYVNGVSPSYTGAQITVTTGGLVTFDINLTSNYQWLRYIRIDVELDDGSIYLKKLSATEYSGYLDLSTVQAVFIYMYVRMFNAFGGSQSYAYPLNIVGDPNAPHALTPIVTEPTTAIYEGTSFSIGTYILTKNNTVTEVKLSIGTGSTFVSFDMNYIATMSNSTHDYYNVSAYLNHYNDNTIEITIRYLNNQSMAILVTNTFAIDYTSFIKDDLNPSISNISSPVSVLVNQEIFLNFTVSDDRGIQAVNVLYKYENELGSSPVTSLLGNTSLGNNMFMLYYFFTPTKAYSVDFTISVTDSYGQISSVSRTVIVSDYNAPKVQTYSVSPSTIYVGDQVTISITFVKESEVITSVSLTIIGKGTYALEKVSDGYTTETWQVKLTASQAGTFSYQITALNTANKNTQVTLPVTVHTHPNTTSVNSQTSSDSTITTSPGYELFMAIIGFLVLVPITRKLRKNS